LFIGFVISGVAFATLAHAETVTATLDSLTPSLFPTVGLTYDGGATVTKITGGAGQINWRGGSASPTDPLFNGNFSTYCIDLLQDINFNKSYTYTIANLADGAPQPGAYKGLPLTSPMGTARADDIQKLYDLHFDDTNGLNPVDNKTAFQLAVWNLIYDESGQSGAPDDTVNGGNFYVVSGISFDPSIATTAHNWLHEVLDQSVTDVHKYTVIALVGQDGAQDQIYAAPGTTPEPPPLSAPLPQPIFGGLALLGLCVAARWKTARCAFASI
jgi:hypothetical protein